MGRTHKATVDDRGRIVLRETWEMLSKMTDDELKTFRAVHVESGYGGLVQAADEEAAYRAEILATLTERSL